MAEVTVRDLRNHCGEVIDRVAKGERITITRAGKPVAELHPLVPARVSASALLERWRDLPRLDPIKFRSDLDSMIDSSV